jgi:hypothetical protein
MTWDYAELERLWKAGTSYADLERHFAKSGQAIRSAVFRARAAGYDLPKRGTHSAVGEANPSWKGDAAREETKRERARRMYPLGECEHDGCEASATDRHHVDRDTGNNARSNIRLLCRKHHMEEDGRRKPPRPCRICGDLREMFWHGRCHACNMYLRRTGRERSEYLAEKAAAL